MPDNPLHAAELGAGYRRAPFPLADFTPLTDQVVVQEHLDSTNPHLILLRKQNTTIGTVLAVGPEAQVRDGITPGDTVVYEEWQGGRWSFPDPAADGGEMRCLIMRADPFILCRIIEDDSDAAGQA